MVPGQVDYIHLQEQPGFPVQFRLRNINWEGIGRRGASEREDSPQ
jgi:hypothetical protein